MGLVRGCGASPIDRLGLYLAGVNLLEDHLVDLLLDVAASGENVVEPEGLSVRHAARFVLIGTGNPEEGDLRPQLLDRFSLLVEVRTSNDLKTRVEVVCRRDAFERDPVGFVADWEKQTARLRRRIGGARERLPRWPLSRRLSNARQSSASHSAPMACAANSP
jgi:magnesium chelatase subunit I